MMRIVLIDPGYPLWCKSLGFVTAIALVPMVVVLQLLTWPFARPADVTADQVVTYLRDFIEGTGGDKGWDDFTSIAIADPALESIRLRAAEMSPPFEVDALAALLSEAEQIAAARPAN